MANYKTGAQRYNDRMDKIFSYYKEHSVSTKDGKGSYDKRYWRENKKGEIVKVRQAKQAALNNKKEPWGTDNQ